MKCMKHLLLFTLIFSSVSMFAQKGNFYIGGTLGFNSRSFSEGDQKYTNWNFSPEFGTFLQDNIQVGIALLLSGSKSANQSNFLGDYDYTESATGAAIYGRYFFKPGMPFNPFVGLNVSFLPGKEKFDYENATDTEVKTTNFGANVNAGFSYAIAPKWSVMGSFAALGFNTEKTKDSDITTTDFGLNVNTLGNRFTIGFYYTL